MTNLNDNQKKGIKSGAVAVIAAFLTGAYADFATSFIDIILSFF